ncbi:hypothetical protein [Burkholderia multivorans]|uniref:Bacteriophage protein n=1 Tax=Burkholderia multivorans TaxID=87883 RepID=A0A2S9MBD3_9BURK|nr:hypothetical protein [Burkholderia multivorans]MBU9525022.1 hypothetical protein [Burkholderia multivorans]MBU9537031.1 hypothetical protein [Burkholderia multivorans]MBU9635461.1 hypothetical protein [Burkholderia multivorans]PRF08634.1 hypothetical protein C6Q07_11070 [Burkholderia multivorans]PRF54662.1 hypothetical protein C6Q15_28275 [Burkholderia multivorans]
MALTPEKREALMLARKRIAAERSRYICFALESVTIKRPDLTEAAIELRRYISDKLGSRHVGLRSWQQRNGFGDRGDAQLRLDRLAWIDWMLDEPKEA